MKQERDFFSCFFSIRHLKKLSFLALLSILREKISDIHKLNTVLVSLWNEIFVFSFYLLSAVTEVDNNKHGQSSIYWGQESNKEVVLSKIL